MDLFSDGMGVVRGYQSLASICKKGYLRKPEKITSVSLRKYMATATSDVLEQVDIAKLLLMHDNGIVRSCVGKRLQDIQFSGRYTISNYATASLLIHFMDSRTGGVK